VQDLVEGHPGAGTFGSLRIMVQKAWARTARSQQRNACIVPRCRVEPYWIKAAPQAAPLAQRQRPGLCLGRPARAHAGATRSRARRPRRLNRQLPGVATNPSSSGSGWPAGVQRVRALPRSRCTRSASPNRRLMPRGDGALGRLSPE
jgi:hypothetical protein